MEIESQKTVCPVYYWAMRAPDRVAVAGSSSDITYSELNKLIEYVADCLISYWKRDSAPTVGLVVSPTPSLDTLLAVLAVLRLGGRIALFNQRSGEVMAGMQAEVANVQLFDSSFIAEKVRECQGVACRVPPLRSIVPEDTKSFSVQTLESSDIFDRKTCLIGDQTPSTGAETAPTEWAPSGTLVIFTSGSEGAPRGVIHSSRTIKAHLQASTAALHLGPEACWLVSLPCFHVGGLLIPLRIWWCGGRCIFPENLQRATLLETLERYPFISHLSLIPQMVEEMICLPTGPELLRRCKAVLLGGAPLSLFLRRKLLNLQLPVWVGYGASEFCSHITLGQLSGTDGGAGYPIEGVSISFDADRRIGADFPALFLGYCGEKAREPGSVYWSSDFGEFGPDKELIIIGRRDRVIISGGEKINPEYIEEVVMRQLSALGREHRCVVLGAPHPKWGERPVLFVERGDVGEGTLSEWSIWEHEIQACIREIVACHLPGLLRPEIVIAIPQFPVAGPGKVAVPALREKYIYPFQFKMS